MTDDEREMLHNVNGRTGVWTYGYIRKINESARSVVIQRFSTLSKSCNTDIDTVGQYTGLKDKNGVEIYEGDILQELPRDEYAEATGIPLSELEDLPAEGGRIVSVVYEAPSFEFAPNEYGYKFLNNPHLFRVVGNVHDNPELLTNNE